MGDIARGLLNLGAFCVLFGFRAYARLTGGFVVFRRGTAVGDQVALTALVAAMRVQRGLDVTVVTSHPWVFRNNPRVHRVMDARRIPEPLYSRAMALLQKRDWPHVKEARMPQHPGIEFEDRMRDDPVYRNMHLAQAHSHHFAAGLDWSRPQPYLHVAADEAASILAKFGLRDGTYALVVSQAKRSYTPNKDWGADRFQAVVVQTDRTISWVQLGLETDAALQGVAVDLRGRTTIRDLPAIVKAARLVLCPEGLFTHMAAAVGRPSVTVYTGFHPTTVSAYADTIAVAAQDIACAPCWLRTACPNDHVCASSLAPERVVDAVIDAWSLRKADDITEADGFETEDRFSQSGVRL